MDGRGRLAQSLSWIARRRGGTAETAEPQARAGSFSARLKRDPWIADATLLKLYPNELQITIAEREPFALWQRQGRLAVIADDGTVLDSFVNPRLIRLPLVVGKGAEVRAKEFLTILERY